LTGTPSYDYGLGESIPEHFLPYKDFIDGRDWSIPGSVPSGSDQWEASVRNITTEIVACSLFAEKARKTTGVKHKDKLESQLLQMSAVIILITRNKLGKVAAFNQNKLHTQHFLQVQQKQSL